MEAAMDRSTSQALGGWSAFVALFGLALCGAAFEATDRFARFAFALVGADQAVFTPELRFAVALMGAVTLGWGLTAWAVARSTAAMSGPDAAATWRRVAAAVTVWFVIDSMLSIATGFGLNAVSNSLIYAAFLLILWRGGVLPPVASPARPLSREGGMG
jgi:hypothetical protein